MIKKVKKLTHKQKEMLSLWFQQEEFFYSSDLTEAQFEEFTKNYKDEDISAVWDEVDNYLWKIAFNN